MKGVWARMATGKRYYWMRLNDSFIFGDAASYLLSLPHGADYLVMFEMLCLKAANSGGRLEIKIGEVVLPYDATIIQRETKNFDLETIETGIAILKKLRLIVEDEKGILTINDFDSFVGSRSDHAIIKEKQRKKQRLLDEQHISGVDNVQPNVHKNVHTDIRDRDKEIKKDKEDRESSSSFVRNEDAINLAGLFKRHGFVYDGSGAGGLQGYLAHLLDMGFDKDDLVNAMRSYIGAARETDIKDHVAYFNSILEGMYENHECIGEPDW